MKSSKRDVDVNYRPFENLRGLLKEKSLPSTRDDGKKNGSPGDDCQNKFAVESEEGLFQRAMEGVEPIDRDPNPADKVPPSPVTASEHDDDADTLARLQDLVNGGNGFIISDTPEYMEGVGYGVNPEVARRLHAGDFSIQAHIDLHGLGVHPARDTLERFLKEAVLTGKTAVLVIHGRGLSSSGKPVLKTKVKEWLTTGPWRKWVIAFTSARACDGGTGATYVLLRKRPVTKRHRRQRPNDRKA
jgi:DNA-nicking Smr family endonuclease